MTVDLNNPPPKVSTYDLRRAKAAGGENSEVYQHLLAQHQAYEEWEEAVHAEGARIRAEREQRDEEARQERREAREAEREAKVSAVQNQLRHDFFTANPFASEADYERLAGQLYDEHLLEQARRCRNPEIEALAERYGRERRL